MKRRAFHHQCLVSHVSRGAFTLLELLVVLAIIGVLAAVALPSISGMRKSNVMANAVAQLTADLSNARHTALRERTIVRLVFVPPDINTRSYNTADARDTKTWNNLQTHPYSAYAFYVERTVGDQPGQTHPRYLGPWRTLPDGIIVAVKEFLPFGGQEWDTNSPVGRPFQTNAVLFPTVNGVLQLLPCVSFDVNGSLIITKSDSSRVLFDDEVIYLARASVLAQRNTAGNVVEFDVLESPPVDFNNPTNDYNRIRIDGLTGRARVERLEIK